MYTGRNAAVATKHDKLPLLAPAVFDAVGLHCLAADVDTDAFGTFSGSVPRRDSARDTAVGKARLGMRCRGVALGLASEGTIGPHPEVPLLPLDRELVVLVDDDRGITVFGKASSTGIRAASGRHLLLVRPEGVQPTPDVLHLGIADHGELATAIAGAASRSPVGLARVENDHRAHCSPSRRQVITAAAQDLAQRLATPCPACASPGFGRTGSRMGLPCAWCSAPVRDEVRAEVRGCPSCGYTVEQQTRASTADPGQCQHCNP